MGRIFKIALIAVVANACGDANFNKIFVSKAQQENVDQLLTEAQYQYDKGKYDKALQLAEKAEKIYAYQENVLLLKANIYLSKAGFDSFAIASNLIDQSTQSKTTALADTTTQDTTANNLGSLSQIIGLSIDDFEALSISTNTKTGFTLYIPKGRDSARESTSEVIHNIGMAVTSLCPLLESSTPDQAAGKPKDPSKDPRHSCESSPEIGRKISRSKFAWALAHLAEAVTFYSVVMYSEPGSSIPNIQRISASLSDTKNPKTPAQFIAGLSALTEAMTSIFPTNVAAAEDSMLNAIFNDLKITSYSFASISGIPSTLTSSVDKSITNLEDKIKGLNKTPSGSGSTASQQNEALRNSLTTASSKQLSESISKLSPADKVTACALYTQINSESTTKPTGC